MSSARNCSSESEAQKKKRLQRLLSRAKPEFRVPAGTLWEKQRRSTSKPWQFPPFRCHLQPKFKRKLKLAYENHRKRHKNDFTTAQAWDCWQPSGSSKPFPDFVSLMTHVDEKWDEMAPLSVSLTDVSDFALYQSGFMTNILGQQLLQDLQYFSAARRRKGGINFDQVDAVRNDTEMTPEEKANAQSAKRKLEKLGMHSSNIVAGPRSRRAKVRGEAPPLDLGVRFPVELPTTATKHGTLSVVPASDYYDEDNKADRLMERGFVVVKLDQVYTESLTPKNVVAAASSDWSRIFNGPDSWVESIPDEGRYQTAFQEPADAPLSTIVNFTIPKEAFREIGLSSQHGSVSFRPPVLVATAINQDHVQVWHRDTYKSNVLASQVAITPDYIFDLIPMSHNLTGKKKVTDDIEWEQFPEKYFNHGVRLVLQPGDVVVLHARLLHRGAPSQDKVRLTLPETDEVSLPKINKLAAHQFHVLGKSENITKSSRPYDENKDGYDVVPICFETGVNLPRSIRTSKWPGSPSAPNSVSTV